jgi:arsenite methyltransferase
VAEAGVTTAELVTEDISHTQLPAESADVVLSNCVINLCPDKHAAYTEAFRLLRRGGRVAISDIILTEPIPTELTERFQAASDLLK